MSVASEMDVALQTLESNYLNASATVDDTWFFPFLGSGRSADGLLYTSRRAIDFLRGDLRTWVFAGTRTFQEWQDLANSTNEDLKYLVRTLPSLSFSGIVTSAADEVKNDVKSAVVVGTTGLATASLIVLIGLYLWNRAVRA